MFRFQLAQRLLGERRDVGGWADARALHFHDVGAVGRAKASAIWLRQELPMHTNSTRFFAGPS